MLPFVGATEVEIRALEQRLAAAVGALNLATAAVVEVLAEAFASEAWQVDGIRSREQWVIWQLGCSRSRATGLVALASRRDELPAVVERFDAGELSEDAAVSIAKHVPVDRDAVTAEVAPLLTHPQLQRALRHMQPAAPPPTPNEAPPPERRELSFFYDEHGRFHGRWCLPPDEGAVVEAALRRARDELFHTGHDVTWADALVALAGRGRDDVVVNMFVDADRPEAPTWLHLGPVLDAGTRRLHTCDGTVRALLREKGRVVAKGRSTRTVGDTLRTIVIDRDGGCRYPLCTNDRWLDAHHVQHWEDGGPTDPSNLVCLCRAHHRACHRGEFVIEGDPDVADGLRFVAAAGWEIRPPARAAPPRPPDPPPGWEHPLGAPAPSEAMEWAVA
jgi:hypothetical protein